MHLPRSDYPHPLPAVRGGVVLGVLGRTPPALRAAQTYHFRQCAGAVEVLDLGLAAQASLGASKLAPHPVGGKRVGTRGDRRVGHTYLGFRT